MSKTNSSPIADVYRLETPEQALALLNPMRAEILQLLAEPASAAELARQMSQTPQKLNYHLKSLEKVGLIRRSGTRQVKNLIEALYQAIARSYVIPDSFGWSEDLTQRMKDQGALRQLVNVSERIRTDALRLMEVSDSEEEVPSAVLETDLSLPDEKTREQFLRDYEEAVRSVVRKYRAQGAQEGGFKAILAVYPQLDQGGSKP
ncbi:winged helix-turn-helix domain-containing protein [Cohnella thailandensis]|uniref:Helix-turn-helix transcriptional regulator n=1 Tax=Cohnella thailandensis TaxID=557557 RepID=A0A841SYB7_9BACL|nr:helix-turn-helix domain-containing protein [Cohnella thailandensis]MBB6635606.1 helix-turn-helix transcriptional regulator [Cohnella thailandensis]MBP1974986.1 DNA-binding transcriptional ArsR family regulator [Cohnella thailandensis]